MRQGPRCRRRGDIVEELAASGHLSTASRPASARSPMCTSSPRARARLQAALIRSHAAGHGRRGRGRGRAGDDAAPGPHARHGRSRGAAGARRAAPRPARRRHHADGARARLARLQRRPRAARARRARAARRGRGASRAARRRRRGGTRGAGIEPIVLEAKEGLALVNGTDGMLGMLALACSRHRRACSRSPTSSRR